jgi:hypothetical protein
LPTEVLRDGSSVDVKIANFALQYENYLGKKESGTTEDLTNEQMQEMLNTARAAKNDKEVNK